MLRQLRPALALTLLLMLLTGLGYPAIVTGLARLLFPAQATGSLLRRDGAVVGSRLIGQAWSGDQWFHGRPSAGGYDGTASGGRNLGPTSRRLDSLVGLTVDSAVEREGVVRGRVPADLVTASASGLDPDLSPAAALAQVPRVARARGLSPASVQGLVIRRIEAPQFGLLGEPRVNVLQLNLALDSLAPGRP